MAPAHRRGEFERRPARVMFGIFVKTFGQSAAISALLREATGRKSWIDEFDRLLPSIGCLNEESQR